jgi:benzylsuccinate CoA-transferase BbsF subunit
MPELPLEGIRVLDFCQMWAGPHATEWLSVMGAEVIKVESHAKIDYLRTVGAPPNMAGKGPNVGSCFASLNWGKKSITLDMTQTKAQELVRKLIGVCDVVAENFSGGVMERWGLGYSELRRIKPDIIYYAGSGYGRTGPHQERPAYAEIIDAFSGVTYVNGYPGGEPNVTGVSPWTDAAQAMHGTFSILNAIYHRMQTGEGQYIDAAMIEGTSNILGELMMEHIISGCEGRRFGNHDAVMAPHGCYPCKKTEDEDEWIAVAVENQSQWEKLCDLMGNPAWSNKEDFSDELSRWDNRIALDEYFSNWTCRYGSYELAHMLQEAEIPAAASLSPKQFTHDKHISERQFLCETDHAVIGNVLLAALPFRFSGFAQGNYRCAPLLGEHNDYVFGELLGISDQEIGQLKAEKVLY